MKGTKLLSGWPRILHEPRGQGSEPVHQSAWETPPFCFSVLVSSFFCIFNIQHFIAIVNCFFKQK